MDAAELAHATARLARLQLDDSEAAELGSHLERILTAFQALCAADVEGIEPMIGPAEQLDVLRPDRVREGLDHDQVLERAPQREGEFFGVPKTIGGDA
jgi:aspartyl-tRNA(Asn)/glutamyl-tRNA(Gln) amidotransferase subunit C